MPSIVTGPSDAPPPFSAGWPVLAAEAGILALLVILFWLNAMTTAVVFDDAWIFVRYARNLLDGAGYTWNPGTHVDGTTAPLWTFVVAGVVLVSSEDALRSGTSLMLASFATGIALMGVLLATLRSLLPEGTRHLAILGFAWLGVSTVNIGYISATGMETALASILVVLFLAPFCRAAAVTGRGMSVRRGTATGVVGALCVLTRPEAALLVLACPVLFAMVHKGTQPARGSLAAFATASGLLAAYAAFRLVYFDNFLPLPFHVKGSVFTTPYAGWAPDDERFIRGTWVWFLRDTLWLYGTLALLLARDGTWKRHAFAWVPLLAVIAYLCTTLQIMGAFYRYFFPYVCGLVVLATALAGAEFRGAPGALRRLPCPLPVYAVMFAGLAFYVGVQVAAPYTRLSYSLHPENAGFYHWTGDEIRHAPEGTTIATTEVGYIGGMNPHVTVIDLAGLNDPRFSRGFDADVLFADPPDIISAVASAYRGMSAAIMAHPRFQSYVPARGAYGAAHGDAPLENTMWVNRDSPRADAILAAVKRAEREAITVRRY